MDAALGFLFGSLVLVLWGFGLAYLAKNRHKVMAWMNAPDWCAPVPAARRTQLERQIIQLQWKVDDRRAELEAIETEQQKTEVKPQ